MVPPNFRVRGKSSYPHRGLSTGAVAAGCRTPACSLPWTDVNWTRSVVRQRGVLSRTQALATGVSPDAIRYRLRSGRWQRLAAGTYATFSGEVGRPALRWAAVLRAGPGAILTHRSAAAELGLVHDDGGAIHVAIPTERRVARLPGMVVHRSAHVMRRRHPTRMPAQTCIEDTVLDLAIGAANLDNVVGWIAMACGRRLNTPDRLARVLRRRERVPGRAELRQLLDDVAQGCHSVLEWRYFRDVERAHGLPEATRQRRSRRSGGNSYDDVRYADYGVRVELDGRAAHPEEARWRDLRRDNIAIQEGDVVLRYGFADVSQRPCDVAGQVAAVLRRTGWPGDDRPCGLACGHLRAGQL
jgi:Transcriptional regulator, AbiEi antitoxin